MLRVGDRTLAATPSVPITRDQFTNTFMLWFHFASHVDGYLTAAVEQQLKVLFASILSLKLTRCRSHQRSYVAS
jgi:hypothetical protein